MIYVGGVPFSTDDSLSSQANNVLVSLMEHPVLAATSSSFKAIPETKLSVSEECGSEIIKHRKCVYIFQREYATVDPVLVDFVGTDEATTCVGLVIRNPRSGMTSVAHMDSPHIVDTGLTQMLSLVVDHNFDTELDVHLIGGFDDASPQHASANTKLESHTKFEGHSFPLCIKIIETLRKSREKFHIQTLHVLRHNTRWDPKGNAIPIFNGFMVETSTGSIIPASFDRTSRCPDEIVRRIRVIASFNDPIWKGRLLGTYETRTDQFIIAPCTWTNRLVHFALTVRELSDSQILLTCSTSPSAEGPDFVDNERRLCDYLIQHPNWKYTFPMRQPRVFMRTSGGGWTRH